MSVSTKIKVQKIEGNVWVILQMVGKRDIKIQQKIAEEVRLFNLLNFLNSKLADILIKVA